MGYQPTLEDIPESSGYQPTLEDIPGYKYSAAEYLGVPQPEKNTRQIQEEFSNPTQWPGFENLSQQEKLKRISLSQFDPANQSPTGSFVLPGSYESEPVRMAASVIPTLYAPELRMGHPFIKGIVNALSRIGSGTAGNIAYESPNIKNWEDLKNIAQQSAQMNALMELPIAGMKGLRGGAEIYNPHYRYASQKANEIKNESISAKALQNETYKPVFDKYGDVPVTNNIGNFISNTGIERNRLYPEAKKIYDEFISNPTFQNLHNLQSKIGKDIRKINIAKNKPLTEQRFIEYRNSLNDAATNFLSNDKNALNQYNLGSHITRNLVEPYNVNLTLRKISKGTKLNTLPHDITNAIKQGREKIIYDKSGKIMTAIPEGHPLQRHFNEITNRLNLGSSLQDLTPKLAKNIFPNIGGFIQNPLINKIMENANPFYYGLGRMGINNTE